MKKVFLLAACIVVLMTDCKKKNSDEKKYQINEATSRIQWLGSAPDHYHIGSFKLSGSLTASTQGVIKGGDFVIPISSIDDDDLPEPVKQQLLDDLKSAKFFNLAVHPTASFQITGVSAYTTTDTSAFPGSNYLLSGNFTMIGKTHPISFPAKITTSMDSIFANAKFSIDRTKWGMTVYDDPAQPLYILPEVKISLSIQAANMK